ncbi:SPASM domain-containing protein [Streptomyces albus]|uniref:SPASM domain-containing protein n=1 Tax=Streptomyces albus TaxID=1888 RepID=UPI003456237D
MCGRCGAGRASVGPDGNVSPCVFSAGLMDVGNVQDAPLGSILGGAAMSEAQGRIRSVVVARGGGDEDDGDSSGGSNGDCEPVGDGECSPGFPSSSCSPRN